MRLRARLIATLSWTNLRADKDIEAKHISNSHLITIHALDTKLVCQFPTWSTVTSLEAMIEVIRNQTPSSHIEKRPQ